MSTNQIDINAVNARAKGQQTPTVEEVVTDFGKQFDALKMKPSKKSMPGLERELLKDFMRKALSAQRAAGSKDTGVAEERRKHCCCVIKDSQVIESCKMHADIAAAEREAGREEERANIPVSFLRLWINEDRKQPHQELVTNEDIMRFINIGYGK